MGARAVACRSIKRHQEWFKTDAKLAGVGLEIMSIIYACPLLLLLISGKTNSPSQANQTPPPHRTSQGWELASLGMKTQSLW
jgi:hypothetical protein